MRKMILSAALACLCGLLTTNAATACHRGWGGYYVDYYYGCGYSYYYYYGRYCYGGYYGGYAGGVYVVQSVSPVVATAAPATLVVDLPADAILTVDGQRTISTSAERVFSTPALEPGREFAYTLEAKVYRAGQEKVIKQRVTVRAGEQTRVHLEEPGTAAAE
jgi:uncharacterized protein (TIGR03000 family)